ncbi:MAG: hypothetical protein QM742_18195 [Aquabacterium sp.]
MDAIDDIVIGSGLAALGVVLGLGTRRRVLVLGGAQDGHFAHYDATASVPCAYSGMGGLGGYWHGVIPVSRRHDFNGADDATFRRLFERFYPRAQGAQWIGKPALFVPWKPIRPAAELTQLAAQSQGRLQCRAVTAQRIDLGGAGVRVISDAGTHEAARVWVAAGAVHTPALLARSFGEQVRRGTIADHVLCYVGHVDGVAAPRTVVTRDGVYFPAYQDAAETALYTLRPARFAFRQLDHGIEQRAAFGLPTGSAIAKIMRSMSPGLLAEAFYNRFGLFASASRYSIYAQTPVDAAYRLTDGVMPLTPDAARIRAAGDRARAAQPFAGAVLSQRPDLHIPGIHLHHSLDAEGLRQAGLLQTDGPVQVVDASQLEGIGSEHHSFKMLCVAHRRAQQSLG